MIEAVFYEHEWEIPEKYQPSQLKVAHAASQLQQQFLKRNNTSQDQRKRGIEYVVAVAKSSGLDINTRGSISHLSKYT